jgi:pyruvate formate lyase activating enzyme
LGDSIPLHFTAFHPDFRMTNKERTPAVTLDRSRKIAQSMGIKFCYVGNIHHSEGQTTYCPACKEPLIKRDWHDVYTNKIIEGRCFNCKTTIPGIF